MAASTVRYTLTSTAYTDVSEGAALVWFTLEFKRNSFNAIRLALGQSLPAADTVHYQPIDPGRFQVGAENWAQEVPVKIELGGGDRVYVRAESETCEVVVHRQ